MICWRVVNYNQNYYEIMVKQEPVNVNWQTLFVFIPIVSIWAFWRIQKLKRGLAFVLLSEILGQLATYGVAFAGHYTTAVVIDIVMIFLSPAMTIYHTRKWSKEWNKKFTNS